MAPKKRKALSKLLFEIAQVLKFDIPAIEIFEGGYAPDGWMYRDMLYIGALEYVRELREVEKTLPLWLHGVTPTPPTQPPPSAGPAIPHAND